MKTLPVFFFIYFVAATIAHAEERSINGADIVARLSDKTLQLIKPTTKYNIQQVFQKGGVTNYIVDGQVQQGLWRVEGDKYCSSWPPAEDWDCYDILVDDTTLIFLSARGARYVMMPAEP
jgi:hypothetical protein